MKIEEVSMGKLSKEEAELGKDLEKEGKALDQSRAVFHSRVVAFLSGLEKNHKLSLGPHYIRDDQIYKQVTDGNNG